MVQVPLTDSALYFFLMLFLLQVQWGLVLYFAPYRSAHENRLALFTLSGLLVAAACGLYVSAVEGSRRGVSPAKSLSTATSIVQGVAAAVNAGVFLCVVVEAWRGSIGPLVRRLVQRWLSPAGSASSSRAANNSDKLAEFEVN